MARPGLSRGLCPLIILVLSMFLGVTTAQFTLQGPARWEVSEFGPCSSLCGGGQQIRQVSCVTHIARAGYSDRTKITISGTECPDPAPPSSRSCNNHRCRAQWAPQDWSECSTTCGLGTQTRRVLCEVSWTSRKQLLGVRDRHQVSALECGGPKPMESRACHLMDCPLLDDPNQPVIVVENYTLWQLSRTRRLHANVGGELNLLPGQNVIVHCPVRHPSSAPLIYWSKDKKLLALYDHLTIRRANPARDAGTYTCTTQHDSADITIKFIKKSNPVSSFYKKWIRKTRWRKRLMASKSYKMSTLDASSISTKRAHRKRGADDSTRSHASSRYKQRDQSHRRRRHRMRNKNNSINRKRRKRSLTPSFVTGTWEKCNATCHSSGTRSREIKCSQVTLKYAKVVAEDTCLKAGLKKPNATRDCSYRGRCAVWTPGPWTTCQPDCGQVSYKSRYLVCQWSDTKELAWNACDPGMKPDTLKHCKPKACTKECLDKSKSCKLASHLRMCRYATFRQQCCQSCKGSQHNKYSWRKTNLS